MAKDSGAFRYAVKVVHGKYAPGPELMDMGAEITKNQVVTGFVRTLNVLKQRTNLNAELYMITPGGPVYLTHSPAPGEANIPFRYGHVIQNRDAHPAALFYLAIHKTQTPSGYKENFIVDRGGQWPEHFRAAAMIPGSFYCVALSGMLANVSIERHEELKQALHTTLEVVEVPGGRS